jgi:hypothetical protein
MQPLRLQGKNILLTPISPALCCLAKETPVDRGAKKTTDASDKRSLKHKVPEEQHWTSEQKEA